MIEMTRTDKEYGELADIICDQSEMLAKAERDTQRAEGRLRQQSRKMERVERERDQAVEFVEAHDKTVGEIQSRAIEAILSSSAKRKGFKDGTFGYTVGEIQKLANSLREKAKESNDADHE